MNARPVLIFALSALGIFILGVILFNYVLMPLFIHQYNTVMVPDIVGMSEKQATRFLKRRSLNIKILRKEFSNEVPMGYVISQNPRADENVKEGRTISAVLSLGAKVQRVPELSGLSLRQSRILLKRNRLRVGRVAKKIIDGESREAVIASSPGPGHELVEDSAVDILISVGGKKKQYIMPDLSGQDLLFIREKLEKLDFRIGSVRYEYRRGVYPNTIIGQVPKPGAQIGEGGSIELVASTTD